MLFSNGRLHADYISHFSSQTPVSNTTARKCVQRRLSNTVTAYFPFEFSPAAYGKPLHARRVFPLQMTNRRAKYSASVTSKFRHRNEAKERKNVDESHSIR